MSKPLFIIVFFMLLLAFSHQAHSSDSICFPADSIAGSFLSITQLSSKIPIIGKYLAKFFGYLFAIIFSISSILTILSTLILMLSRITYILGRWWPFSLRVHAALNQLWRHTARFSMYNVQREQTK